MQTKPITGSEALALGALEAGVQYVSGYPGSPATATVEALMSLSGPGVRVEWSTNEKSAFDAAFGASLAGIRTLVCIKSVGLNVALDSLMVSNLAAGDGGFVVLVGGPRRLQRGDGSPPRSATPSLPDRPQREPQSRRRRRLDC